MSTYVPPHLRFTGPSMDIRNEPQSLQSLAGSGSHADEPSHTDRDIVAHFWRDDHSEDKMFIPPSSSTLNGSKEHPDQLAFMLVYAAGHPKWEEQGIVYVKSALHLLPGFDGKLAEHQAEMDKQAANSNAIEIDPQHKNGAGEAGAVDASGPTVKDLQHLEVAVACHNIADDDDGAAASEKAVATGEATTKPEAAEGLDEAAAGSNEIKEKDKASRLQKGKGKAFEGLKTRTGHDTRNKSQGYQLLDPIPPIDYAPPAHSPIAVFKTNGHRHYGFKFVGWHKIERIAVLLRKSTALGDLMSRKWEQAPDRRVPGGARSRGSWLSDLSREWAVIKLVKLDTASEDCPADPAIAKLPARCNRRPLPIDDGPTEEGSGHGGGQDGQDGQVEDLETLAVETKTSGSEVKTDDASALD